MGETPDRERSVPMENVEEVKKKSKRKESRYGKWYRLEFKFSCVKLRLEEGIPVSLLSKEVGTSKEVIPRRGKAHREREEAGLRNRIVLEGSRRKLRGPVCDKIVKIKGKSASVTSSKTVDLLKTWPRFRCN
jgi:hypothetical protein